VPDAGAGTGFLPLPLARQGYQVTTVDMSAAILQNLTSKAAPASPAPTPPTPTLPAHPGQTFDAVVERHLLRTLPNPGKALAAWRAAAPGGRLALIEGSSGGTGRPLSPHISMKHPGESRSCNGRAEHAIMCHRARGKLTIDMWRIVGSPL
jgi:ubiquinone/menaquinone biosynthesis C-methylase UbiE